VKGTFKVFEGAAGSAAFWELHDKNGDVLTLSESFRSVDGIEAAVRKAEADVEAVRQAVLEATPAPDLLAHLQQRVNGKGETDGAA
jgi:hypothetical protein